MAEIVMVPVPREHLGSVYELLAMLMEGRIPKTNEEDWSAEEIARLKRMVRNRVLHTLLELIAGKEGERTEYRALLRETEKALGEKLKLGSFRAQFSWLMKYSRRIKGPGDVWPLRKDIRGDDCFYFMSKRVCKLWLKAE